MRRVRIVLALLGLMAAGIAAPFAISAIRAPSSSSASSTTVTIRVTATEFKFALSRRSLAKPATVIFKITNKGKIAHNFKINGKKTPLIQPKHTATLKVVFKKKGRFAFVCTLAGHAANGMKGTFTVAVKASTTTVTTTTGGTTTGTTTTTSCSSPTTTVNVGMREYAFDLDTASFPAGCIQFVIKNNGAENHNFDIAGVKAGTILSPGGTETWAVQLTAGNKTAQCDVPFHIDRGMIRTFTVT